jgi:5'-nucleotidase
VVSGINLGSNMGMDILYSGTISAATEAAILGIPSFAVSLTTFVKPDFSFAAKFSKHLAHIILNNRFSDKRLSPDTILNVNIPNVTEEKIKGIKITFQSKARYHETYEKRIDPRQQVYYWLTGEFVEEKNENESDVTSVKENYISITPLKLDLTNYEFISALKKWRLEKNLC